MTSLAELERDIRNIKQQIGRLKVLESPYYQANIYVPVWSASGTAPAIGNGTLLGQYTLIGKLVIASLFWGSGNSTTYGTGNYRFSLPFTSVNSSVRGTGAWLGSRGGTYFVGTTIVNVGSNLLQIFTNSGQVTNLVPGTWANGDFMWMSISYYSQ